MKQVNISKEKKELVASWDTLQRIFIRPEDEASRERLVKYMEQILFGLQDFLKKHVGITQDVGLKELSDRFVNSQISHHPSKKLADVIHSIIEDIAPHAVNVASPYFVGHMTSAIPFFMVHLQSIMAALNQNPVKLETSKVVSIYERQVISKIHRLIYGRDASFYQQHVQRPESTLGSFIEDGTLANLTALWVARNKFFKPGPGFNGIESDGMHAAFKAYDVDRCVVLVSQLGHYSIRKACGLLGIGNANVIPIDVDGNNRINIAELESTIHRLSSSQEKIGIIAVIGIAGTTETGSVDPLYEIAQICKKNDIHFHVDAAWGGPTLLSRKYRALLAGIETADSVTIDGHKQFYLPMSCGMVYFKDPQAMDVVAYHAAYVNRKGSVDLGIKSLVGSRASTSLILGSALEIMGAGGYELMIDHGIQTAAAFAQEIDRRPLFELVTAPELNILTYRIDPESIKKAIAHADTDAKTRLNRQLNLINITVQRMQRQAGKSFVSRTTLNRSGCDEKVVFRAVIMNPMTNMNILNDILDEQELIYRTQFENRA